MPPSDATGALASVGREQSRTFWRVVAAEARHVLLVLVWVVVLSRAFGTFVVEGASMEPTLSNRALLIVDTVFTSLRPFHRGDVVVFRYPRNPSVEYVKRVIALPGETVMVAHGYVFVNGSPLAEPYLREPVRYYWGPATVPSGASSCSGTTATAAAIATCGARSPLTSSSGVRG